MWWILLVLTLKKSSFSFSSDSASVSLKTPTNAILMKLLVSGINLHLIMHDKRRTTHKKLIEDGKKDRNSKEYPWKSYEHPSSPSCSKQLANVTRRVRSNGAIYGSNLVSVWRKLIKTLLRFYSSILSCNITTLFKRL